MKNIGEAFSFYAKYTPEMESLYNDEQLNLLPKMDSSTQQETENQIYEVGDQASTEAADFLLKLTDLYLTEIQTNAGAARLRRRSTMESNWDTEIQIWPKKQKTKPRSWDYTFGTSIIYEKQALKCLVWCWSRNSIISTQEIVNRYNKHLPKMMCNHHDLDKKTIVLNIIDIIPDRTVDGKYSVDEENLMSNCQETVKTFVKEMLDNYLNNYA